MPSAYQTSDRAACEREEEDSSNSPIAPVSLARISYKTIGELVNAVCMKRTHVRCHVISLNGVKDF